MSNLPYSPEIEGYSFRVRISQYSVLQYDGMAGSGTDISVAFDCNNFALDEFLNSGVLCRSNLNYVLEILSNDRSLTFNHNYMKNGENFVTFECIYELRDGETYTVNVEREIVYQIFNCLLKLTHIISI